MATGNAGPFVSQDCNQALTTPTSALSWASVLPATSGQVAGLLSSSIGGDNFTVGSNTDSFEGLDNTSLAWNGSSWVPAFLVYPGVGTIGGHFNSETTTTGPPPEGVLGDNLLGAIAPNGTTNPNTIVNIAFTQALSFVEFQVSSETNTNFTAQLIAFDSNGHILGTYQVVDTGGGGICAGLSNTAGPQPCNDAPDVQFYDPEDNIASVELIMNDTGGALLDTLEVAGLSGVPEPSSSSLFAIGILLVLFAAKRGHLRRRGSFAGSTRD